MSDIKNVIELLCKHLNLSIKVAIQPEYFRLSKYNNTTQKSDILWTILHILSFYAAKEKQNDIYFEEYDKLSATKLYFAFLQYPAIEFYGLSESCHNNRVLLLAFAWLLATQNVLNIVVRVNLTSSLLGRECSCPDISLKEVSTVETSCSVHTQIKNIIHHNSKVNFNIKHISELICKKVKLLNKAHDASLNFDHLAHMNVMEIAFIKHLLALHTDSNFVQCKQQKSDLRAIGVMLDIHLKWMEKEHLFYDWMISVIKEYEKSVDININRISWDEIGSFISLLEHVIKKKLYSVYSEKTEDSLECRNAFQCTSRLLRTSDIKCEVNKWLMDVTIQLNQIKETLGKNKEELALQLKNILMIVPLCVRV
ncbi:uncharacterized protein LOC122631187 isoform X2 [Vespula pensylvanica]|uniref:Tubulin epsilon and delta complex protein 1 domain-containing protein n=1 Tax=Vespula pensylvanica TaxID=30213 RepID=A0A834U8N2_VESPE|nr:uncharacterized protein LOC122631187 isoform X2 [Vespula pensylvanica]KAF7421800.1 hypothetical protein H0235_009636 [Vespula pensylvanica]